jgi:hypothetical protein
MFERTISINSSKKIYLDYIKNKLKEPVKNAGGIIADTSAKSRAFLMVACDSSDSMAIELILKSCLIDVCCYLYKYDYLQSRLKLTAKSVLEQATFLKALVCFDSEGDRELVSGILTLSYTFELDAFINFKLLELKRRWTDIIDLTNENIKYLNSSDTFTELLKYLINTNKTKCSEVHIIQKNDKPYVCDSKFNTLYEADRELAAFVTGKIYENESEGSVIMNLINLAPKKIIIHDSVSMPKKEYNMIKNIFLERIYYSKNF